MKISKYLKVAFFVYLFSLLIVSCRCRVSKRGHNADMDRKRTASKSSSLSSSLLSSSSLAKSLISSSSSTILKRNHKHTDETIDWSRVTVSYVRWMEIYNSCSQLRLQITSRRSVNAYGHSNTSLVRLRVETLKLGSDVLGMRISSGAYNTYLCFNRKGKLTGKFKGSSLKCLFREKLSWDFYSQYQSLYNRSWYVGFNRKGKPLYGFQRIGTRRPRCFKFVNFHEKSINPQSNQYTPFSSHALEKLIPFPRKPELKSKAKFGSIKRHRHNRNKKRTHRRRKFRRPPR